MAAVVRPAGRGCVAPTGLKYRLSAVRCAQGYEALGGVTSFSALADGYERAEYGDPSLPFRAGACGHLINDPYPDARTIQKADGCCSEAYGRAMIEYMSSVTGRSNCVMKPHRGGLCVLVVATRDIADGEELLAPYGYEYWNDAADPGRMLAEFTRTRTAKQEKALRAYAALFNV